MEPCGKSRGRRRELRQEIEKVAARVFEEARLEAKRGFRLVHLPICRLSIFMSYIGFNLPGIPKSPMFVADL
jgi:hypothetical protein